MSNARLKRKIAGMISKGLLDPDWRSRYRTRIRARRHRSDIGLFAGLWAWLKALVTRSPKPEFRSQQEPKNIKHSWTIVEQRALQASRRKADERRGQDR